MEFREIKFKNWNFGKLFQEWNFRKFKNWNFEKLFQRGILENLKIGVLEN